ncbi:MAG: homoserine dehydrogenase [Planctomycetota bacterium]|nr:homoserine dehydrogenase [Planctomycetota bacterium]
MAESGVNGSGTVGIGMIGCGTVGGGVARLLAEQSALYQSRLGGKRLELRRVLVRDVAKAKGTGLVAPALLTADADAFFATPDMPIVVEVAGGRGAVSQHFRRALEASKHVVTANKSLLSAEGPALFALARARGASIAFEASCGGGIPIMTALQFGLMANRIEAVLGILNGTCNYILTEMVQRAKPYATALKEAQEKGFAEADPTLDVSGRDAAQKLAVLASLAFGAHVDGEQVGAEGIDKLDVADIHFAREMGYTIKLLAIGQRAGDGLSLRVAPCFVPDALPLAQVHGSFNALSVYGHANGHTFYYGRGAGQMPTASAVVSDVINVASGWYPRAFASMNLWCDRQPPVKLVDPAQQSSRFYLRVNAKDVPGVMGKISTMLGDAGISIAGISQREVSVGKFVPVVITTHQAKLGAVRDALARIKALDATDGDPVCIRIIDMPEG